MLETYLLLESIARGFKEIVLDTRIIELPSGEPAKSVTYRIFNFIFCNRSC